jgi:hypothetical protein
MLEELLGTAPGDKEIYESFVAAKAEGKDTGDEVAALPEEEIALGTTVFARGPDGGPALWDYQIKGFFKDACSALARVPDSRSKELKAYKKEIDGLVFVFPRQIKLSLPTGGKVEFCQRPLRAQTARGERIALARSETVPAGTVLEFEVRLLKDSLWPTVQEWLNYGELRGLGQWRNSGKGRFKWEAVK